MLKFHPYSILLGDTRVEFVIYCVLNFKSDHKISISELTVLIYALVEGDETGAKKGSQRQF